MQHVTVKQLTLFITTTGKHFVDSRYSIQSKIYVFCIKICEIIAIYIFKTKFNSIYKLIYL